MTKKKSRGEQIRDSIADKYPSLLVADGFDDAIVGTAVRPGSGVVVAYDIRKMEKILVRQGMEVMDAREYLDFNVFPAYVGNKTPTFIDRDW